MANSSGRLSGSMATPQAPAGLGPSGYDPGRKPSPSDAVEALRSIGGRATATRLLTALTCDNCGAGFETLDAQLAMQRAVSSGLIKVEEDWTLNIGDNQ